MSDQTSCVRHQARSRFFVLYGDYLLLTNNNYAEASALRVLETKTNDRLIALQEEGRSEICQEDLWLTLVWKDFSERSLHLYDVRSYQGALPRIERLGFVKSRYVKLDDLGRLMHDEQSGALLVYQSYKQAQCDRRYFGVIVKQYLFLSAKVNAAIDKLDGGGGAPAPTTPPTPSPGADHDDGEGATAAHGDSGTETQAGNDDDGGERGMNAREGNLRAVASPSTSAIIPEVHTKLPGGSTKGGGKGGDIPGVPVGTFAATPSQDFGDPLESLRRPPGIFANNKNPLQESSSRISSQESADAAVAPGGAETKFLENSREDEDEEAVTWCVESVCALAARWLPTLPTNRTQKQRQADREHWLKAAKQIVEAHSVFAHKSPHERIEWLVRLMRFMTEPDSPCSWQRFMRQHYPQAQARLWHVANNLYSMSREMETQQWYPRDEQSQEHESDAAAAAPMVARRRQQPGEEVGGRTQDLVAQGASGPRHAAPEEASTGAESVLQEELPPEPVGMEESEADRLIATIAAEFPLWPAPRKRRSGGGGYSVDWWYKPSSALRLYAFEQFEEVRAELRKPFPLRRGSAARARDEVAERGGVLAAS